MGFTTSTAAIDGGLVYFAGTSNLNVEVRSSTVTGGSAT
jgi:hypothetical protein